MKRTFILVTFFVVWQKKDVQKIPKSRRPRVGRRYIQHAFQCESELDLTQVPYLMKILRELESSEGESSTRLEGVRLIRAKNPPRECLGIFWSSQLPRLMDKVHELNRRGVELDFKK